MNVRLFFKNAGEIGFWPAFRDSFRRKPFVFFERLGFHVLPADYTSPVPDTRELRRELEHWYRPSRMQGVAMEAEGQLELLRKLQIAAAGPMPDYQAASAAGFGHGIGEVEVNLLTKMISLFRPNLIIEVGAGLSSFFALEALKKNGQGKIRCIDPHPFRALKTLAGAKLELAVEKVQNLDIESFQGLGENDFLFIDSTHVSKLGSDVDFLILEVLPSLRPGVIVHFHDCSLPWPAPVDFEETVFRQHFFWNESQLLQAFLAFNSEFRPLLGTAFLARFYPEHLTECVPVYDPAKHFPSSFWIQRKADAS